MATRQSSSAIKDGNATTAVRVGTKEPCALSTVMATGPRQVNGFHVVLPGIRGTRRTIPDRQVSAVGSYMGRADNSVVFGPLQRNDLPCNKFPPTLEESHINLAEPGWRRILTAPATTKASHFDLLDFSKSIGNPEACRHRLWYGTPPTQEALVIADYKRLTAGHVPDVFGNVRIGLIMSEEVCGAGVAHPVQIAKVVIKVISTRQFCQVERTGAVAVVKPNAGVAVMSSPQTRRVPQNIPAMLPGRGSYEVPM